MLTETQSWDGGDIVVKVEGIDFMDGCAATLMYKPKNPDGSIAGVWERGRRFDAAGDYRFNHPAALIAFEITEHPSGRHADITVTMNGERVLYEYQRASGITEEQPRTDIERARIAREATREQEAVR